MRIVASMVLPAMVGCAAQSGDEPGAEPQTLANGTVTTTIPSDETTPSPGADAAAATSSHDGGSSTDAGISAPAPSSYPVSPITVKKGAVVPYTASTGSYFMYVPNAYDATHHTPTKVLLWMHGCGGNAAGEAAQVSPGGAQDWISISVGGRDGTCWNPNTDVPMVLGALADVKKHLNVDPRRVVIGGYSSGGDIAYRTAFYNGKMFAGLLAENTSPFRDTGSSQAQSLAAASTSWKMNIVHLAHISDTEYPLAGVVNETNAVKAASFPLTLIEKAGDHFDNDTATSGTVYDRRQFLLPYLDAGWEAPE